MGRTKVYSWLKVFRHKTKLKHIHEYRDLIKYLKRGYKVSGRFHSYNKASLHDKTIVLDGAFNRIKYNPVCKTIRVGAAVQIKTIMKRLSKHGRRLPNSGNFFEQTFAGAAVTGTHGFGNGASMADAVLQFNAVVIENGKYIYVTGNEPDLLRDPSVVCITDLIIKTLPEQSFEVTNCVCTLSDLKPAEENIARAFAILPYSDQKDPVCLIAEYKIADSIPPKTSSAPRKRVRPWQWWRVKLWWLIDGWFPPLRRVVQRVLSFIKLKPFKVYTDPKDYDALYDPDPGLTGQTGGIKFSRWSYRPTYTCYNIALFCEPDKTKELIMYAIKESESIKRTLLRCFIGVRQLSDTSSCRFTGNARGPVDAIDFYCSPKHAEYLIQLQRKIQREFDVRPHYGKTVH